MATFTQIYSTRALRHSSLISPKDKISSGSVLQYSPRRSRGPEESFPEDEEAKNFRKWSGQILFSRQGVKKEVALHDFSQTQMSSSGDGSAFSPSHANASPRYKIELSEKEFIACRTPTVRRPSDLFADRHLLDVIESGAARTASAEFTQTGNLPTPSMAAASDIVPLEEKLRTSFENEKDQIDEVADRKISVETNFTEIQHPLMEYNEVAERSPIHRTQARTPAGPSAKPTNSYDEDVVVITGKDEKLSKQSSNSKEMKRDLEMLACEEEKKNVAIATRAEEADAEPQAIDHIRLQKEIEQLKNKLNEKELRLLHSDDKAIFTETEALNLSSRRDMQAKIDALQQELLKKERLSQSEQYHLSQKQNEIADLRSMLQSIHEDIVQKNEETANMGEEIDKLRCQVAALRRQLGDNLDLSTKENEEHSLHIKVAGAQPATAHETSTFSDNDLQMFKKEIMETEGFWLPVNEQIAIKKMDSSRRMYLAAVLTAREKPGEESLALAAEFRMHLQHLLSKPEFSAPLDDTLASQDLILQMF